MIGYIFKAENSVTKKTYIGKYLSVSFNRKYIGNDPGVLADAEQYGVNTFTVSMIKAFETVKDCEMAYDEFVKAVKDDENYYNCEKKTTSKPKKEKPIVEEVDETPVVEKPKKSRKKKIVEE